jgi:hypothetical protein
MDGNQLLKSLGIAMGLPDLQFDKNGCTRMLFDGKTAVSIEHDPDAEALQIYSILGPIPSQEKEAIFQQLLVGNLFCTQTLGATLAIDTAHHEIILCRNINTNNMSSDNFANIIEQFVATAEAWELKLNGPQQDSATAQSSNSIDMNTAFWRA